MPNAECRKIEVAYATKFDGSAVANKVLEDLAMYCYENKSTMQGDRDLALVNEGRRQVIMHIRDKIEKGRKNA